MGARTVAFAAVAELLDEARASGLDEVFLRHRYRLPAAHEAELDAHLSASTLLRMWHELPALTGRPDLGFAVAERFARPTANLATLLVSSARTVEDGVCAFLAQQAAFNQFLPTEWERSATTGCLVIDERRLPTKVPEAGVDFALSWWWLLLRRSSEAQGGLVDVRRPCSTPKDLGPSLRVFGVRPSYQALRNELVLSDAFLRSPLVTVSPQLAALGRRLAAESAARHLASVGLPDRVRMWMTDRLLSGSPAHLAAAAKTFGLGERTLQRRLSEQGCNWTALSDEVRANLAKQWVDEGVLTMAQIGERLGFADPAGFYRAFRRWFAAAPGEDRRILGSKKPT